jgi:hypothetical protein
MSKSNCGRPTIPIQAWQESAVQNTSPTSEQKSLPKSKNQVSGEEQEKFQPLNQILLTVSA